MPAYNHTVSGTSNGTPDTVDGFVEITGAASSAFGVTRIRISIDTAASDARIRVRVVRKSVAGTGGTAGTAVRLNPNSRATSVTIAEKNGAVAFSEGTVSDLLDQFSFNGRAFIDHIPVTPDQVYSNNGSGIWGVSIASSVASTIVRVTTTWED